METKNLRINEDAFLKLSKRKKILEQGKGHFTGYPSIDMPWLKYYTEEQIMAPIPNMSALEYMKLLNNNNLNLPAIEFLGTKITYLELFKKINEVTKALVNLDTKPGEIITIMLPACPEETYIFYAIDQIGACANFIFPGTPLNEVKGIMDSLKSKTIVMLEDLLYQPNTIKDDNKYNIITTTMTGKYNIKGSNITNWADFIENGKEEIIPNYTRNQEEPLFIAKTGGTTGKPKSVMLADRSFNLLVQQHLNSSLGYNSGDRWLRLWPIFSATAAVSSCHLPLCAGMTMILEPAFDVEKMDEIIFKHKPAHTPLITSCVTTLINSELLKNEDMSYIKTMGTGGEGMTEEFEKAAKSFFESHNVNTFVGCGYGMTENGSGSVSRISHETSVLGGTGVPMLNNIVSIFDPETQEELTYGQVGEVCILSSTFMLGYYNDQETTKNIFKQHKDGKIWLHSGDLGYMNDDGQLFIKGRMKRVIFIYSGEKVYPQSIEEILESINVIDRAVVVSEPDPIHDNAIVPCAFVTLKEEISDTELKQIINDTLTPQVASYVKINSIYQKTDLPKTQIGKIDIKALEQEAIILSKKKQ